MLRITWTNPGTGETLTACGDFTSFYWSKPGPDDRPLEFPGSLSAHGFAGSRVNVPYKVVGRSVSPGGPSKLAVPLDAAQLPGVSISVDYGKGKRSREDAEACAAKLIALMTGLSYETCLAQLVLTFGDVT